MLLSRFLFQVNLIVFYLHNYTRLFDILIRVLNDRARFNLWVEDATSKRQMIVKEIFETEYNYISQLSTITNVSFILRRWVCLKVSGKYTDINGCGLGLIVLCLHFL